MSYIENIPAENLGSYERIDDWNNYYRSRILQFNTEYVFRSIEFFTLMVTDKIFTKFVQFNEDYQCKIEFNNCYFQHNTNFNKASFKKQLSFNACYFDKEISIHEGANFESEFDLINVFVKEQMIVFDGKFSLCRWSLLDYPRLLINGGDFKSVSIGFWGEGAKIHELNIQATNVSGYMNIMNDKTVLHELWISGIADKLSITIEHISVNLMHLYRYRNDKSLRLNNIKSDNKYSSSQFSIFNSYLGKTEFNSIDFMDFQEIFIKESNIIDCTFVNIVWPQNIYSLTGRRIYILDEDKKLETKIKAISYKQGFPHFYISTLEDKTKVRDYFSKEREVYRQLKYALGKQGDNINEQYFHSKEMKSYFRSIDRRKYFWTKAVILFSDIFGDFGRSISRPIFWLGVGHLLFFLILVVCNHFDNIQISLNHPNYDGLRYGVENYLFLINPLRRFDINFHGFTIIIDLLMRIWSTYMLYNFVRASRRFIK